MKKFNLRGVLDGLRSSVSAPPKLDIDIEENLRSEHFQVAKTVRHGFPYQPTAMAYDPVQNLLAIGTKSGSLRIFGRPGVDVHVRHEVETEVLQVLFLVNEGALVSACADDQLHLWSLRQKKPEIVHSLKFQREKISYCHLPFQSKWLYVGTKRGNVHVVNIESFILSGYTINWNKAIELSQKTHPGEVVHLSDCPIDPSKLLIGFELGAVVMWDLKTKLADVRFSCPEPLTWISWHYEGRQFMCSHTDGSLSTWNLKTPQKATTVITPHAKTGKDGKPEACRPISKVEWKTAKNGESYMIFSGGMAKDNACSAPSLTVMHSRNTTVLEMEHPIIGFITLCPTPWHHDLQDPYGIVVLLKSDLVVVDLLSPGYPCFENPYPMDIHESPVTAVLYLSDCPPDLIPAFYSVGSKQKKTGFSERDWPVHGGEWGTTTVSYPEMMITGHADGSLKFWDASAVTLQVLYKLKTGKLFDKTKCKNPDPDDDPYAVQHLFLCAESRMLGVAGFTDVLVFKFSKSEATVECPVLEISVVYEVYDDLDSPELEYPPMKMNIGSVSQQSGSVGSYCSTTSDGKPASETMTCVKVKSGGRKWAAGYQPHLACLLCWNGPDPPPPITSLSVNSSYGLMAFGNECGLAIVDILQMTVLLNLGTPDLYGSMDPYSRAPRSPKSKNQSPRTPGLESMTQLLYNAEETRSPGASSPDQPELAEAGFFQPRFAQYLSPFPDSGSMAGGTSSEGVDTVANDNGGDGGDTTVTFDLCTSTCGVSVVATPPPNERESQPKPSSLSDPESPDSVDYSGSNNSSKKQKDVGKSREGSVGEDEGSPDKEAPTESPAQTDKLSPEDDSESKTSPADGVGENDEETHTKDVDAKKVGNGKGGGNGEADKVKEHGKGNGEVPVDKVHKKEGKKHGAIMRKISFSIMHGLKRLKSSADMLEHEHSDHSSHDDDVSHRDAVDAALKRANHFKFDMIDLTSDDIPHKPQTRKLSYSDHVLLDKADGSSFSRSRSSSISSLENISKEAIQCLNFADAYSRKTDTVPSPCLWVGTTLGSVLVIPLGLPEGDGRKSNHVIVSPSGTIFRLRGSILAMSFLDWNGILIPAMSEHWRDDTRDEVAKKVYTRQQSMSNMRTAARMSPTLSQDQGCERQALDKQLAIICSEKQARVIMLPSQVCAFKVKVTETSIVTAADVVTMRDSVCLACYVANGHLITFSLPSLRPLLDVDYLPQADLRMIKTFCFSSFGHALYFCSPTEVQKLTLASDVCDTLNEMLGELFIPCETPERPQQGFFKNLFAGRASILDREELFGETSGKASKGVAKYSAGAGMAQAEQRAGGAMSEIGKAKQAAIERGEKLGDLDERTAAMRSEAELYADNTHKLMMKYRDKKWYQF